MEFSGDGLFDMDKEEIKRYKDMIYVMSEKAIKDLSENAPQHIAVIHFIHNLEDMEQTFNEEEDYEMSYLLNHAITKLKEKYGKQ